MDSSQFFGITTFIYLGAVFCYVTFSLFRVRTVGALATVITAIGILFNLAGLGLRWIESHKQGVGHIPLSNMYESLVFFALSIAVVYLVIEFIYKTRLLGSFAMPFAFLAMAYAALSTEFSKDIKPLLPALQSNWLTAHVITCFIGYAAFAISCGLSIFYLVVSFKYSEKSKLPNNDGFLSSLPSEKIAEVSYKMMIFGFLWLSAGIITGAVWANSAWGTYWSWDPKETWSLITWFVYAFALHAKYTRNWDGSRMAWMSILGFISVIFTYYGVNFLLSGLHSYGG